MKTYTLTQAQMDAVAKALEGATAYLKSCGHHEQSEEDKRVSFKDPDHAMYLDLNEALTLLSTIKPDEKGAGVTEAQLLKLVARAIHESEDEFTGPHQRAETAIRALAAAGLLKVEA